MVALAVAAVVWTGCAHKPQVRPASIVFACADANFYADHLHWASWSTSGATAKGTGHRNDCKPYCAAGHFHSFPITVHLSHVVTCVKGRSEFARVAWTRPTSGSETMPCSFLKLRP
jgi:hypothetical protein